MRAVIQGGGMGRCIAVRLGALHADVVVLDASREEAEATAREVEAAGGKGVALQVDLTDLPAVQGAADAVRSNLGGLDALVVNLGWNRQERFLDNTPEFWNRVVGINLMAPIYVAHSLLPIMVESGGGSVVFIASEAGRTGSTGDAVYAAAKAGVIGFAKTLAREFAKNDITVNCVSPGPTDTPLMRSAVESNPNLVDAIVRMVPLRRVGKADDIAGAVAFLLSADASYMTGQVVAVSGGLTMM